MINSSYWMREHKRGPYSHKSKNGVYIQYNTVGAYNTHINVIQAIYTHYKQHYIRGRKL
jgi:hypothetical protein